MQTCFPLPSTLSMNSGIGSLAVCNPTLLIKIVSNHSPQFQPNLVIGDKTDQHSSSQMSASSEFSNIYNFVLQTVFSVAMMIVQHFENTTLKSGYLCLSRRCHQQARQSRRSGWGRLCGEHCPSQG